jgi:DNA-binding PadR family transcriptional regulator
MRLKPSSYLILGMVHRGRETGYAIKRAVDRSTRFFWAASFAQVYPELAALENDGYRTSAQEPHGARPRKTYRLTDKGHAALGEWLRSERIPDFEQRDEGLLRLFFADSLHPKKPSSSSGASASAPRRSIATSRPRSCRSRSALPAAFLSSSRARAPTTSHGAPPGCETSRRSSPTLSMWPTLSSGRRGF